jgi:hypothetical protein
MSQLPPNGIDVARVSSLQPRFLEVYDLHHSRGRFNLELAHWEMRATDVRLSCSNKQLFALNQANILAIYTPTVQS